MTSDTSSVSDDEAHKNQTRKTRKPRSSIIRQLTWNLMYNGRGGWMAFKNNSLAMWILASEMGGSAGTTFVGAWLIKRLIFMCYWWKQVQGSYMPGKWQGNLDIFKVRELSGNYVMCQKRMKFCKIISGKCQGILHFSLMKLGYLVMM